VSATGWDSLVTTDQRRGMGPLGHRLLLAFVLVALSSVVVLTLAALIGTARGLAATEDADRTAASVAAASAAGDAYSRADGWAGADLSGADAVAADAGARLVVVDADGALVRSPYGSGMGSGTGMGAMTAGRGFVAAPVVVDGQTVGTVRLGFGTPTSGAAQQIAWTWIVVAAVAALVTALAMAWFVTGRIARPLARLTATTRAFAAGDRSARPAPADSAAPGELGELARAFDLTAEQVERSELARRRMAADLAHELRTPLAALQAGLEELRDGLVEPDAARLAALHAQSLRMGRVVEDLAELSSAETASLSLRRTQVDLAQVASDAVEAARPALDAAGLRLETRLGAGAVVQGDSDRLHQVVGNLLVNTVRHCRTGDVVTVSVGRTQTDATLAVSDTGPGIAEADLPFVFDRLWRGRADRDFAGSGIGLAVVRELVVAHGGRVRVESDGSHGATFTVALPLASQPTPEQG
jgi:two-component system, OmpR family, sensor histidine kinase BaeS